ncbi:MAG: ATP-binding protein [Leptolyngbya sp. SIO1E4]|nr:ATP-binding protein [Leptolyngbya sp. SIO1E4]
MDNLAVSSIEPASLRPLFQNFDHLKRHLEAYAEGDAEGKDVADSAEALLQGLDTVIQLGHPFNLSAFEQMILLLATALELEPNFQSLCAKAQGDDSQPYATLGLALSAFPNADWSVLSPQNALHYWQLIHTEPGRLLTQAPIKLDRRILCHILDEPALSPELAGVVTPLSFQEISEALPPSYQTIAQQIVVTWSGAPSAQRLPLISLTGNDATTLTTIAVTACDRLGLQLMALPAVVLPTHPPDLKQLQRHWEREALLSNSVLLIDNSAAIPGDPSREAAIALFLETLNTPVILSSCDRTPQLRRPLLTFEVPPLPHGEQIMLWRTYLGATAANLNGYVGVLASQFKLTPTAIQTVCLQVAGQQTPVGEEGNATTLPAEAVEPPNTLQEDLWTLCRHQARPTLDDLAQRIEATATWEDLVLPDRQRQALSDIATHLNYRARVYQDWGFAKKSDRGLGISALFYGESGTGKTMAAEVLAQACRLDLYRIDLSTVVSKYIGETEKNLRRIFDAAETGGVILLFDEADALFGKRTEVKDSHDRHANIEVSYLLQRMEAYQGLAILTSNLKDSLDKAFLRRLRFMVSFPFPDAEARAQIWQRIFPAQTPTQDLDYARLGQLKVAGGNIRTIALNAAFLAAQANQPVTMGHLRQAAQRDYLKLEKLLTTQELKGWEPSA